MENKTKELVCCNEETGECRPCDMDEWIETTREQSE